MSPEDRNDRRTIVTSSSEGPRGGPPADPGTACLVVIYGNELGKRIALGREAVEFGRSLQNDVPLEDEAVSRKHARIAWTGTSFVVRDLGSTNGTLVNDATVTERVLDDGDQVKIGRTIFKFIYGGNIELSYHEEIYRLMTYDGLTQIHNKRAFQDALDREVSRCRRYQHALSLVLFDVDHFKKINDARGHLAGDHVLRQLAAIASQNIRREDTLARVGGEEFGLIVPEVPFEGAVLLAEKIRALFEAARLQFEGHAIPVTSSFGVAPAELVEVFTPQDLYRLADERLYAAKKGGRNRVVSTPVAPGT